MAELLAWVWSYDHHILCFKHGNYTTLYIWLVPLILSLAILVASYTQMFAAKMKSRDVLSDCLKEQNASAHEKYLAKMLQKLVLI